MKNKSLILMITSIIVCISLVFVCLIAAFLSQTHYCLDPDCAVCAMIESTQSSSAFHSVTLQAGDALSVLFVTVLICFAFFSVREGSLVGLKVKLSD